LARYRLRPVPWAGLAAGLVVLAALALPFTAGPGPGTADRAIGVVGCLLGVGAALLTAPETDPDRGVLDAVPVPAWRTVALRLAAWAVMGGGVLTALAFALTWEYGRLHDLLASGLPAFLFASALAAAAAARTSGLAGGGATTAAAVVLAVVGAFRPRFPVRLLALPQEPGAATSRALLLAMAAVLVTVLLVERARRGVPPPGRGPGTRGPRHGDQERVPPQPQDPGRYG
jgi:hypothetical protein